MITDYSNPKNWVYCGDDNTKPVDVFFVCPTVYLGDENSLFLEKFDRVNQIFFRGAVNMEKGIYDTEASFYAPFYRHVSLSAFDLPYEQFEPYILEAYRDIEAAFRYYLENFNNSRPIVLAGFSQGADMVMRLLKNFFGDGELRKRLVACYAPGWRITAEELADYPFLKFAEGEDDTGVIIAFNSEAPYITESAFVPKGISTLVINPLNWKRDATPASKEENKGTVLYDLLGKVLLHEPHYAGAYIDTERGTLKVTDIPEEDFPAQLIFPKGVYHLYDYQFFYDNLKENVVKRINTYLAGI